MAVARHVHGPKELSFLGASPSAHDEAYRRLNEWSIVEQRSEIPSPALRGPGGTGVPLPPSLTLLPTQGRGLTIPLENTSDWTHALDRAYAKSRRQMVQDVEINIGFAK